MGSWYEKVAGAAAAQTVPRGPARSSVTETHSSTAVAGAPKVTSALAVPPGTPPVVVTVATFVPSKAPARATEYEHVRLAPDASVPSKAPQSTVAGAPPYESTTATPV